MPRCAFWENRDVFDLGRGGSRAEQDVRRETGLCISEDARDGSGRSRWRELKADDVRLPELSPNAAEAIRHLHQERARRTEPCESIGEMLSALAPKTEPSVRVHFHVRGLEQQVVIERDDALAIDVRAHVLLEVRGVSTQDGKTVSLQREHAFKSCVELLAARSTIQNTADALRELVTRRHQAITAKTGLTTAVIPPGADAGVFFHEIAGHPLEGDVVSQGASFLARKFGERVAEEFVSISDSPIRGSTDRCGYGVDDEGTAAQRTVLVEAGRVNEPLLDLRASAHLRLPPNGHGRRTSFRHSVIPRMSHTELEPHQGDLASILSTVPSGILIRYLTPRHVNVLTGDFSFFVVEAQQIADGQLGAFIGPAILRGNGLRALAGIDAVGADSQAFFGRKGCGKLDHGPLAVSFGNPSFRIQGLEISEWI